MRPPAPDRPRAPGQILRETFAESPDPMFFASDNGAPTHPAVMAEMLAANAGNAMPYGNDEVTRAAADDIRAALGAPDAGVFLTGSGTAANALALAVLAKPWSGIWCHPLAHVNTDECGAPEFFTAGAKMLTIPGPDGKITPDGLRAAIASRGATLHTVQAEVLSLSNLTETGSHYSADEIADLVTIAKAAGYRVHLDGARLGNALVASNAGLRRMVTETGVDVLSFGGAKGGMMNAEAVVLFDPDLAWEFELRRKRAGQLTSKMRFMGAQFRAWLKDDLWLDLARTANARAERLRQGLGEARLCAAGTGNIVFADLSDAEAEAARAEGALFYASRTVYGREGRLSSRLVCSYATTEAEVDRFLAIVTG